MVVPKVTGIAQEHIGIVKGEDLPIMEQNNDTERDRQEAGYRTAGCKCHGDGVLPFCLRELPRHGQ